MKNGWRQTYFLKLEENPTMGEALSGEWWKQEREISEASEKKKDGGKMNGFK